MIIKKLDEQYRDEVLDMMRVFYDSPAVLHTSSDRVLKKDLDACISDNPLVDGYVFLEGETIIGYSMVSKNFTTEYGGLCIWVEDLYFKEEAAGRGRSVEFFHFLEKTYPEAVRYKLEVEQENERAVAAYKKNGYSISEYFLMTKEIDQDE